MHNHFVLVERGSQSWSHLMTLQAQSAFEEVGHATHALRSSIEAAVRGGPVREVMTPCHAHIWFPSLAHGCSHTHLQQAHSVPPCSQCTNSACTTLTAYCSV